MAPTQDDFSKINAFELWCYRRMLQISWKAHKTNEYVLSKVTTVKSLVNIINKRKLDYFGHISRRDNNNLEKGIMNGAIEGRRRRGRPKLRWVDGVKRMTGGTIQEEAELAGNREEWKQQCIMVTAGRTRPE